MKMFRRAETLVSIVFFLGYSLAAQQTSDAAAENIRQEKLAKHAAIFTEHDNAKPFSQRKAAPDGSIDLSKDNLYLYADDPSHAVPQNHLGQIMKGFQVIVVAIAREQRSALTPCQSFIYSDWDFTVTRVLKNTSGIPTAPGTSITITRPGGAMAVGGHRLIARDANFPDFVKQHTYLLGLYPLADSSSFLADSIGSFDVSGPTVAYLEDPRHLTNLRDYVRSMTPLQFISEVEAMERKHGNLFR